VKQRLGRGGRKLLHEEVLVVRRKHTGGGRIPARHSRLAVFWRRYRCSLRRRKAATVWGGVAVKGRSDGWRRLAVLGGGVQRGLSARCWASSGRGLQYRAFLAAAAGKTEGGAPEFPQLLSGRFACADAGIRGCCWFALINLRPKIRGQASGPFLPVGLIAFGCGVCSCRGWRMGMWANRMFRQLREEQSGCWREACRVRPWEYRSRLELLGLPARSHPFSVVLRSSVAPVKGLDRRR